MNSREKLLSIVVGSLLLLVPIVYFGDMYLDSLDNLQSTITATKTKIGDQETDIAIGIRKSEDLQMFEERALPWDADVAKRVYQAWLLDLCDKRIGFDGPEVSYGATKYDDEKFATHSATVSCKGDIEQMTRFLHEFYETDLLHYFDNISVRPSSDKRELSLVFNIRVLSMIGAKAPKVLEPKRWKRLKLESVDQYVTAIAHRNPFGFKNNKPKISLPSRTITATINQRLSVKPSGSDIDPKDQLSYTADLEEFDRATIDKSTGLVSWTPKELGEYKMKIYVEDNGFPPESSFVEATVKVVEPVVQAPPKPKEVFDTAKLAIVTAILKSRGKPQVWVSTRNDGKVLKLREGDQFKVGQTDAVVKSITQREFQFETKDGDLKTVSLGQNIAEAQGVSAGE